MSSNEFLLAHGEKLALALVVGISAWAVSGTVSNPETHPSDVSELVINNMIARIESNRSSQPPPQIKTPPDYVTQLRKRLDGELPSPAFLPWLTGAPDVGPVVGFNQPLYIYELLPPKVTGKDRVGNIELTVEMPQSLHPGEGRISDGAKREWKSQGGKVQNAVERAGVYIEYCIGNANGTFKPVEAKDIVGGFAPMQETEHPSFVVDFKADAVWETYYLKVQLVVRATGYPIGKPELDQSERAVLVSAGRFGAVANWPDLEGKVRKADPDTIARFVRPLEQPFVLPPTGDAAVAAAAGLKPGESYFLSAETRLAVKVSSATRFAFDKSYTTDDNAVGAVMLVTTQLSPLKGVLGQANVAKWLLKPETFKIKKGEKLGSSRKVVDPRKQPLGQMSEVDLSTPFVLDELKADMERTLYYELDTASSPLGGGQRDLILKPKTKTTEVAHLKNPVAIDQTIVFPRLIRIEKPFPKLPGYLQSAPGNWTKIDGPFIYPDFEGAMYDEDGEFRRHPADFTQQALVPPAPVWHEKNEGPIVNLGEDYQTNTKYLEFEDGRFFIWDPVNKRIVIYVKPDSRADTAIKRRKPIAPAPPPSSPPSPTGTKPR